MVVERAINHTVVEGAINHIVEAIIVVSCFNKVLFDKITVIYNQK